MLKTILTKLRALLFIPLIFALGCEAGTNDKVELGDNPFGAVGQNKNMPIQEIVAQTFVLQDFEALLVATRISGEMQSPPYTVFAPWDFAFKKLPYWKKITQDPSWYGHLRDLALGHIHEGYLPPELAEGDVTVTMLGGDTATVTKDNTRVRVDGERVIGDTPASDGHIYMLDEVREPKWTKRTVFDVINDDERFSILAQILNHPGMSAKREELKSTAAELTLFAPTDEALAGFDIETCVEPECTDMLNLLVEKHVVDALIPRRFTPTQHYVTQANSSLDWDSGTRRITCSNADETQEETGLDGFDEEHAINGIVHPIDALLCTTIASQTGDDDVDPDSDSPAKTTRVALIKVNFQDLANPCTDSAIYDNADITDRSYNESSYDTHFVDFEIVADVTIAAKSTDICSTRQWGYSARDLAESQGVDFQEYSVHVYLFPDNPNCGPGAAGGSTVWMESCARPDIISHEVGHTLGLGHAGLVKDDGSVDKYADTSCPMGAGTGVAKQFNAPHRVQMGWMPENNIRHIDHSGSYTIHNLEEAVSGVQVLQIDIPGTSQSYWISYRLPLGLDQNLSRRYLHRTTVHTWPSPEGWTVLKALLDDGDSFDDPLPGFTITQLSHDEISAEVEIQF